MNASSRKRWFRFSLRSMLLFVTVLCVLLGLNVSEARRQREAVVWVKQNGGIVHYDYQTADKPGHWENNAWVSHAKAPGPRWLRELVGVDFFASVENVDFPFNESTTHISPLANLPELKSLRLDGKQITDLSPLADLADLKMLDVSYTNVSDLWPLCDLNNLENLNLWETPASDLSPLRNLKRLKYLDLSETRVTDLSPLASLTKLTWLSVNNTSIADISPLAHLSALNYLDLSETQVTDLSPLEQLVELEWLGLDRRISEDEVARLRQALPNCSIDRVDD